MTTRGDSPNFAETAYSELTRSPQDLTAAGFGELVAIAARVAASQRYRAFVEELGLDDPSELVGELACTGALHRVVQNSIDSESFTKQLYAALGNVVIDLHRRTDAGALARRVADMLRREERFQPSDVAGEEGRWCSESTAPFGEWDGNQNVLANAVWSVDVAPVTEWKGSRRTPVCSDSDLVTIIDAVLAAASVPLGISDIVYAVQHRFDLLPATHQQFDDETSVGDFRTSVESQALAEMGAQEILALLSDDERTILSAHGMTDRDLAQVLGCSPAAANGRRRRLTEVLRSLGWTDDVGPSSYQDERETP